MKSSLSHWGEHTGKGGACGVLTCAIVLQSRASMHASSMPAAVFPSNSLAACPACSLLPPPLPGFCCCVWDLQ
jgi:hypothetical protein